MTPHEGSPTRAAFGVSGLVVLFVLLAGFVAMHGVAATTETGVHHSPVAVLAAPGHGMAAEPVAAAEPMAAPGPGDGAAAAHDRGEGHDGGGHGTMTGCLVVLLGAVVALVLRLRRPFHIVTTEGLLRSPQRVRERPGRQPPRRSRISLCVIRV